MHFMLAFTVLIRCPRWISEAWHGWRVHQPPHCWRSIVETKKFIIKHTWGYTTLYMYIHTTLMLTRVKCAVWTSIIYAYDGTYTSESTHAFHSAIHRVWVPLLLFVLRLYDCCARGTRSCTGIRCVDCSLLCIHTHMIKLLWWSPTLQRVGEHSP